MKIENSVVLITGAGRGLGSALVEAVLSKSPKRVYVGARNLEQVQRFIYDYGNEVIPVKLDITNIEDVNSVARIATDVNVLINNAGVISEGAILEAPLDFIKRDMDVNYFGTLNMLRAFSTIIEANNGGAIVNILSISALANTPNIGSYSASKAAGQSLTQAVRPHLFKRGISVHGVFPGPVDTDMTSQLNITKAKPIDVAHDILTGVEQGEEDIFPDEMSRQGNLAWRNDPKMLEGLLAAT